MVGSSHVIKRRTVTVIQAEHLDKALYSGQIFPVFVVALCLRKQILCGCCSNRSHHTLVDGFICLVRDCCRIDLSKHLSRLGTISLQIIVDCLPERVSAGSGTGTDASHLRLIDVNFVLQFLDIILQIGYLLISLGKLGAVIHHRFIVFQSLTLGNGRHQKQPHHCCSDHDTDQNIDKREKSRIILRVSLPSLVLDDNGIGIADPHGFTGTQPLRPLHMRIYLLEVAQRCHIVSVNLDRFHQNLAGSGIMLTPHIQQGQQLIRTDIARIHIDDFLQFDNGHIRGVIMDILQSSIIHAYDIACFP